MFVCSCARIRVSSWFEHLYLNAHFRVCVCICVCVCVCIFQVHICVYVCMKETNVHPIHARVAYLHICMCDILSRHKCYCVRAHTHTHIESETQQYAGTWMPVFKEWLSEPQRYSPRYSAHWVFVRMCMCIRESQETTPRTIPGAGTQCTNPCGTCKLVFSDVAFSSISSSDEERCAHMYTVRLWAHACAYALLVDNSSRCVVPNWVREPDPKTVLHFCADI